MTAKRVQVAAVSNRLPRAAMKQSPEGTQPEAPPTKTKGRPRKAPDTKARGVTVTLWPHELEALEALRAKVSNGLPVGVPRSDLARLAIALLLKMKPQDVRAALTERRG